MAYHQHIKQEDMTKSAVDWLHQELTSIWYDKKSSADIFEQAKEMEKEQIEEAFELGQLNENSYQHTGRRIHKDKEEFYIKTYKN